MANRRRNHKPARPKAGKKARQAQPFFESLAMYGPTPFVYGRTAEVPTPADNRVPAVTGEEAWGITKGAARDAWQLTTRAYRLLWNTRTRALLLALAAGLALAGTVAATRLARQTYAAYRNDLASPAVILAKKRVGTTILDRHGAVLYQTEGASITGLIPLDQVPQSFKDATIAAEDPKFYDHPGVSWQAMLRAGYVDVTHRGAVEGGSTLTQQLVKNAVLTSTKSVERKFQEVVLSVDLEKRYSKDQILQMYVSEVPYGQGSYGVEAAAQTYFGRKPSELTLGQSALLAGLPLGPSRFDPAVDPVAAKARRDFVLQRMRDLDKITPAQLTAAKAEPVVASPRKVTIRAPHFVFYVLRELRAKYGDDKVDNGGLTVTTTLDLAKQDTAQAAVTGHVEQLAGNHVTNGGLVSLDPATGDILAMVGSTNYDDPTFGAVNVTTAKLQPGSSFKPFAYVTAFAQGWNGATVVDDAPISLPDGTGPAYAPQNYDRKFHGPMTLRRALSNSFNIPAVKVLQKTTIPSTIATANALGITTLDDPRGYGLSLVLGGGAVEPLEMAGAYGAFATGGTKVTPRAVLTVRDRFNAVVDQAPAKPSQPGVLDPRYVAMITSILSDNAARTEMFGPNSALKLSRPAAVKTGTTDDFKDNWSVGYTPGVVTAVWVGNNDNTPMQGVTGATGAAPIWHDYMEAVLSGTPVQPFTLPDGVTTLPVTAKGCLAGPGDSAVAQEVFLTSSLPTNRCTPLPVTPAPTAPTPEPAAAVAPVPPTPEPVTIFRNPRRR